MMKSMPKKQWLKLLSDLLADQGWSLSPVSPKGAEQLYYWRIDNLVLMVAVEVSRRYSSRFTASYYLGRSFCWSLEGGDSPRNAYARIGQFLTRDERNALGLPEPVSPLAVDAWWAEFTEEYAGELVRAITLTKPRFLAQPELAGQIFASQTLATHLEKINEVIRNVDEGRGEPLPPGFKPSPAVPAEWYRAAALVLRSRHAAPHVDGIKFIAEDAWCFRNLK